MTTIPLTPALRQELKAALKDNTIQFPYECSDDALAFIADEADGWMEMRALAADSMHALSGAHG